MWQELRISELLLASYAMCVLRHRSLGLQRNRRIYVSLCRGCVDVGWSAQGFRSARLVQASRHYMSCAQWNTVNTVQNYCPTDYRFCPWDDTCGVIPILRLVHPFFSLYLSSIYPSFMNATCDIDLTIPSVRPYLCVCPSVTIQYWVKTAKHIVKILSLPDRPIIRDVFDFC